MVLESIFGFEYILQVYLLCAAGFCILSCDEKSCDEKSCDTQKQKLQK